MTLAVLCGLVLIASRPAEAQTETVLYNFCSQPNCADGANPTSRLTSDGKGNLYGTTYFGGIGSCIDDNGVGCGTVFQLDRTGSETVLYSFTGGADGANASGPVIFDSRGNIYGTAGGGANGSGVVFELSPVGGNWTETVLYNFCSQAGCADGEGPGNGLVMDTAGNLFSTTSAGGSGYTGTVFQLSQSGGTWTEQVLYNFPMFFGINFGLTMDAAGNIYFIGASSTLFELSPNGSGGWNSTVVYNLRAAVDTPTADNAGNLYGMTQTGNGGTAYKLSPVTREKTRGNGYARCSTPCAVAMRTWRTPLGWLYSMGLGTFTAIYATHAESTLMRVFSS